MTTTTGYTKNRTVPEAAGRGPRHPCAPAGVRQVTLSVLSDRVLVHETMTDSYERS